MEIDYEQGTVQFGRYEIAIPDPEMLYMLALGIKVFESKECDVELSAKFFEDILNDIEKNGTIELREKINAAGKKLFQEMCPN